ncbi:hypothetical protein B0A55_08156 [Friedmanniomyces simplex]|uniref:CENP-S associating centromere protein X-domain-containing protein n=1 Tax=Friedmanniomyces simplex TaxID=329884 RepID=A0A4U0WSV2_9PEZI|nr:hypothetical protein B0A55_08156 [Friedmanniomyces simplex]
MPRMPPRKEPKEAVVYAASKRKAPPFKPQRPSQVPRTSTTTTESGNATKSGAVRERPATTFSRAVARTSLDKQDEDGEAESNASDSSDEGLGDDPLATIKTRATNKPAAKAMKKKSAPATKSKPALSISSSDDDPRHSSPPPVASNAPPAPSQLEDSTQIPQALLLRLLHEHFANKETQIDKHAIQVVQKYVEVFVREAIARTAMGKREAAEKGEAEAADAGWLELEDLEKVAPGMMLDF